MTGSLSLVLHAMSRRGTSVRVMSGWEGPGGQAPSGARVRLQGVTLLLEQLGRLRCVQEPTGRPFTPPDLSSLPPVACIRSAEIDLRPEFAESRRVVLVVPSSLE